MNDLLTLDDVRRLAADEAPAPRISIYLPTHPSGAETQQDPVRLKNALGEIENQLLGEGIRRTEVKRWLAPARNLLDRPDFWRHQSEGLALFLSPESFSCYRLPLSFERLVVIGGRYHLKPLFSVLTDEGRFFILALSQARVRLFEASSFHVRETPLAGVPEELEDVAGRNVRPPSLQFHTGAPGRPGGRRDAIFHGHGAGRDDVDAELEMFYRRVDDGVRQVVGDPGAPVVVAAVKSEFARFRAVSKITGLLEECVSGSPDELDALQLQARAWPLVEPVLERERDAATRRFEEARGAGLAGTDLEEVVAAACHGRIAVLFVTRDAHRWGTFDRRSERVQLAEVGTEAGEDLLDLAAAQTLLHGGAVYAVQRAEVPGEGDFAAVFRYPRERQAHA